MCPKTPITRGGGSTRKILVFCYLNNYRKEKQNSGPWSAGLRAHPGRRERQRFILFPELYTASLVVTLQGLTGEKTWVQRGVSHLPEVTPPGGGSFPDAGSCGRLPPYGRQHLTTLAGNRPEMLSIPPKVTQLRRGRTVFHREPGSPRGHPTARWAAPASSARCPGRQ